jgi:DNA-binding GntR family transcriptional regulator
MRDSAARRAGMLPAPESCALRRHVRITGRVPSILTLAQEYGVSHRTSQRALTTLADEGLIVAVRGRGFYLKRDHR